MSMEVEATQPPAAPTAAPAPAAVAPAAPAPGAAAEGTPEESTAASGAPVYDSSFVNGLLASLPGVDPSDPRIQSALQQIQAKQDEDKSKDTKK